MEETEISHFLHILVRMGEALQNSGAEVFRVEDTLNRIAIAYGAEDVNVFVITSSIVVTLTMPSLPPQTETRRLRHAASNDLLTLEKLNALSRRICTAPPSIEEFQRQLNAILAQHPDPRLHLAGSVLAASSFAIFFGGNLWDGLLAGGIAVLICWMERYLSPFCMNGVEFQFIASFLSGVSTLLLCRFGMQFHADKVLIGIIMLLIPGIMLTNSIRDILLGDIISGSLRLVEAILMAATLALGIMAAIFLANLLAGFCAALYAEILARCCNAPSTPFFITAAIPLIPGSTLYYCMNAVVSNDLSAAEHFGEQTFLAALGIAGGMAIAWCLADLSRKLHALAIRSSGK